MKDKLSALETADGNSVRLDLWDACKAPLAQITMDRSLMVADLAKQAEAFDLPPGEDYALLRVSARPDGTELTERLSPETKLGDIPVGEDDVVRLQFAPALRGA